MFRKKKHPQNVLLRSIGMTRPTFRFENIVLATFRSIEPLINPCMAILYKRIDSDKSCAHRPMNPDLHHYRRQRISWEKEEEKKCTHTQYTTFCYAFKCSTSEFIENRQKNHNNIRAFPMAHMEEVQLSCDK